MGAIRGKLDGNVRVTFRNNRRSDLGWALVPFLVVIGVFFTIASGFVQFTYFKRMFRVLSGKNQSGDPNAISAREALLVSVGGRVGGGNIAGVAVAITLGGPGAVFWM
jgi:AGCS family alanine or glycine:cation symporter